MLKILFRNAFRNKLRSGLTILGITVAILAFGLLRTVIGAWYAGVEAASASRLVTRNAISIIFPLPICLRRKDPADRRGEARLLRQLVRRHLHRREEFLPELLRGAADLPGHLPGIRPQRPGEEGLPRRPEGVCRRQEAGGADTAGRSAIRSPSRGPSSRETGISSCGASTGAGTRPSMRRSFSSTGITSMKP